MVIRCVFAQRVLVTTGAATALLVREIGAGLHELGDGGRKLLRQLPTVDDLVVFVILEVEIVAGTVSTFVSPTMFTTASVLRDCWPFVRCWWRRCGIPLALRRFVAFERRPHQHGEFFPCPRLGRVIAGHFTPSARNASWLRRTTTTFQSTPGTAGICFTSRRNRIPTTRRSRNDSRRAQAGDLTRYPVRSQYFR